MCSSCNKSGCGCSFDPSKPVVTKDGHKARILVTDLEGSYPIVAAVPVGTYTANIYKYSKSGICAGCTDSNPYNLVNIPETVEKFVNVYANSMGSVAESLEEAKKYSCHGQLSTNGTVKLIYTDGKLTGVELVRLDCDC